jgi:hypothetical protein
MADPEPLVFIVAEGAGYCDPATGLCVAPAEVSATDALGQAYGLGVDAVVVDAPVDGGAAEWVGGVSTRAAADAAT